MNREISIIAGQILVAKAYLDDAHKLFGAVNAIDGEELGKEERAAWRAVVDASDALHPVVDWAIEKR